MKVGVIGAGTMGQGIAKAFAQVDGYEVALCDIKQEWAEGGKDKIAKGYARLVAKEKMTQEKVDGILAKITPGLKEDLCKDCDLIVEAAFEDMNVKKTTFAELDKIAKPECIFASHNFIRSAGLKKCIPIIGRVSPFPISVIEREEVLEAKIHSGLAILSNSANVVFFTFISSKAASTIRSQSLQRSSFKPGVILARMPSTFSCVIFSFATSLAYPFAILSFPPSAHSCLISQSATSYPSTCANALAIPWPIVPAPITPTFILVPPK